MAFLSNLLEIVKYDPQRPMLFNSGEFFLFYVIFIIVYTGIYRKKWWMSAWVILFSFFFYYKTSGWYLFILVLTSITDFSFALFLHRAKKKSWRIFWLILGVVPSMGLLAYFKYTNFLLSNWYTIIGRNFQPLDIFLPVGISFYTFQSVSYIVDVYTRKLEPTRSLMEYAFFLSFFPQLVAGPIVKAHHFLPQLKRTPSVTKYDVYSGLWLIMIGLIKKAVISDYIAQYNDLVFAAPQSYNGFENLMAIYGYTLQIYMDFSGYSDMAIGLGRVMGFDLGINFRLPYQARNITEFWRRWHISLSTWLRDYVYIPLGGNRKGKIKQYRNLMITMLVGGLWHGADWKFVWWGGLHGIGLVVHKILKPRLDKIPDIFPKKFLSWFITFHFVIFLWIFFRMAPITINETKTVVEPDGKKVEVVEPVRLNAYQASWIMVKKIFTDFDIRFARPFYEARHLWVILLIIGFAAHTIPLDKYDRLIERYVKLPWIVKLIIFILVVQLVIQFSDQQVQPFIYFQF